MRYLFFLGCTAPTRVQGYELSTRKVLPALGVELVDEPLFTCCSPAPIIPSIDFLTSLAITARNLCIAEEAGSDIVTLCNGCYGNLSTVIHQMEREETREKVNRILAEIGYEYKGKVKVKHVTQVLFEDVGIEKIKARVKRPLPLRIGAYYGCHLIRPEEALTFDYSEVPTKLDQIVTALGAESIWYESKFECCGGTLRGFNDDISVELGRRKLVNLDKANVDCVAVTCPFCFLQFDRGQVAITDRYGEEYNIPIFTITELIGLAMGYDPTDLGIRLKAIDASKILERIFPSVSV